MRIENPKISAVLITNDDLNCIGAVESVLNSCIEVIVVNTVRTEKIKPVLDKIEKVKYYTFEWCDDFSKARNFGIDKAVGDWILTIDSDERLKNDIKILDDKYLAYHSRQANAEFGYLTARLFKNLPEVRYKNAIHETIDHVLTPENVCDSDIIIEHTGYEISEEDMKAKMKRNYELMFKDKGNVVYNLHMGNYEYHMNNDYDKALKFYKKALQDKLNDEHKAVIWINIHACYFQKKLPFAKLIEALQKSIVYEPFQMYSRVNLIEHWMSVMTNENKDDYIFKIKRELRKLENILEYKLSNLIVPELKVTPEYIQEKYNILSKFGIERMAI